MPHAVMDLLDELANKSLVVVNPGPPGTRYHMLDTIRHYAREKLARSSEEAQLRARHLDYCLGLAQSGEIDVVGREDPAYFKILETELDNIRAALDWSLTGHTNPEDALRLASALRFLWYISYQTEGLEWLGTALENDGDASATLRAKALNGMALIASFQGNYSEMKTLCEKSAAIAQEAEDKHETALALELLGVATAMEGGLEEDILLLQQTRRLAQEQEDKWMQGFHCVDLGYALMRKGDYSDAEIIFNDGLRVSQEIGMKINEAYCLAFLAALEMRIDNLQQAKYNLRESARIFMDARDRFGPTMALIYFAELAKVESKLEVAAKLFAAVAAICQAAGITLFPSNGLRWIDVLPNCVPYFHRRHSTLPGLRAGRCRWSRLWRMRLGRCHRLATPRGMRHSFVEGYWRFPTTAIDQAAAVQDSFTSALSAGGIFRTAIWCGYLR